MLSATYLFSDNSHMYISYLKFCLIFFVYQWEKFVTMAETKHLTPWRLSSWSCCKLDWKGKKNQKFYLYMDYLKFPYHPLNLNKSKKTSVRYLSLPIFDLWQTSQTNYCYNKVHAECGVKELSKGEH